MRSTRFLLRSVALLVAAAPTAIAEDARHTEKVSKIDAGIDTDDNRYPIFVRMSAQLFRRGGDYERFCREHRSEKRSVLRARVLKTLRQKSRDSWEKVAPLVQRLEKKGQIRSLERFWIVNGFAGSATGEACRRLAESEEVEFVYRQRGPARQHRTSSARGLPEGRRRLLLARNRAVYERVLKEWRDDSDDPFTAEGLETPWNIKRIGADAVWKQEKITGRGVVVGLIDSGLMVTPSLTAALWKNPNEELNDKDDDGNGYVDDLFGYDFAARSFYALGDGRVITHGSMCGGIIAGRPLNSRKLVTGIAPRTRLMVLRGMGLLKSYEYALANGADVISMSYMFIRTPLGDYRGVYRLAHEHLAAGGVVAVGGAGNFNRPQFPRGRQIAVPKDIPCVIAAAGIREDGEAPAFSSRGPCYWNDVKFYADYPPENPLRKPDVTGCIGGFPVWGRAGNFRGWKVVSEEGDNFALLVGPQGNSFSGPHAAGVAALMLSANPEMNPWQVKELMEKTCRDLGEKGRDDVYGAGLLQALPAVQAAKAVSER